MAQENIYPPKNKYYFVHDNNGYFVVPESMIKEMEKSIIPKIQVFGIPLGFLGIAITLFNNILVHELPKHIFIGYTFGACLCLITAILIAYHLFQRRNNQLETIKKIVNSKKHSDQTNIPNNTV